MKGRLDPALAFILRKLREENKSLPPGEQMGLEAYCKKYGILAPKHWESIAKYEVLFCELGGAGEVTGENTYEDE